MSEIADADAWVIMKRGLFFRPDCCGYTGIRDEAGRYSHEFAKGYEGHGVTIARLADVPEFMPAAFEDLVIKHLCKQRDRYQTALQRIANGGTSVLISATLDECPINPEVLELIVKDAVAALVSPAHEAGVEKTGE